MTHCPDCGEELESLERTAIDTFDNSLKPGEPDMGDPVLYECPHCGVVIGISDQ